MDETPYPAPGREHLRDPAESRAESARFRREAALRIANAARRRSELRSVLAAPIPDPGEVHRLTERYRDAIIRSEIIAALLRAVHEDERQNELRWRADGDGLFAASGFSAGWIPYWAREGWGTLIETVDTAASSSLQSRDPAPVVDLLQRWGADPRLADAVSGWITISPEQLASTVAADAASPKSTS